MKFRPLPTVKYVFILKYVMRIVTLLCISYFIKERCVTNRTAGKDTENFLVQLYKINHDAR